MQSCEAKFFLGSNFNKHHLHAPLTGQLVSKYSHAAKLAHQKYMKTMSVKLLNSTNLASTTTIISAAMKQN